MPSRTELDSESGIDEVLLVFPGKYKSLNPQVPLSLLYLASALQATGFKPRILDMRVENWQSCKIGNPVFVGITSMSGLQISYGIDFARKVRAENPNCPIVWGGVHPTLLPEQTAASEYVDVVVRGEGEATIIELAKRLNADESLADVKGVTYKAKGTVISTVERELINLDMLPSRLPYELLHRDRYPSLKAGRIHVQTSRGCPHKCGFCYNSMFCQSSWRGKSSEKVLDEIEQLLQEFPNATCIDIVDDNFFVDRERVEKICMGSVQRGITVPWRANCRLDYMAGYDRDFIELLEKANCIELDFGAETGSPRLLSVIGKGVSREQMVQAVQNLRDFAPTIEPYVFWMSGFPTETKTDLNETFELVDKLHEVNPKTQPVETYIYTPFPSPLLNTWESEIKPLETLEDWAGIDVFHYRPRWHTKEYLALLETVSAVMRYAFYPKKRLKELSFVLRLSYWVLNRTARFRWRHKYFGLPFELRIASAFAKKLRRY